MKIELCLFFIFCFLFETNILKGQNCSCQEYVYLNELSGGGKVHKYAVSADGSFTEIFNNGNAWYPGADTSELSHPHGLATDLNGNLYIAATYAEGNIRRLDCNGNIHPTSDFLVVNGERTANIYSVRNTLYTNTGNSFDLCTGAKLDSVILCNAAVENWGFYIDDNTGYHYATTNFNGTNAVYRYTEADYGSGNCVQPLITEADLPLFSPPINGADNTTRFRGIVTDPQGNIYLAAWHVSQGGYLFKFDANGNYLSHVSDLIEGDGGFYYIAGLVYSETSGTIFASTQSETEDCVAEFDTNLNYLGAAVAATGDTGQGQTDFNQAKALSIIQECCPSSPDIVIDTIFCNITAPSDKIYLTEILDCGGIICEGEWTSDSGNTGFDFDPCDNSIIINSEMACGTFSLFSDGASSASQCGQFMVTVNIETAIITGPTVSGEQSICSGSAATILTASGGSGSMAPTYQWQMSTTSCTDGFIDIAGANGTTYDPGVLFSDTYYRVVTSVSGECASETCNEVSNCVAVTLLEGECLPITITRN